MTAAVAERMDIVITEPGVYEIPENVYHADPVPAGSLSASGAKKLLPPSCPARFAYDRDNPPQPSSAMELGTAAHKLVLGVGADLVLIDAENYKTKAAQLAEKEARAAGKVPLLPHQFAQAEAMAAAIRSHPAGALFDPATGRPEQSLFWIDPLTGIWRRARLDWLPFAAASGCRMVIPDLKSCVSAEPGAIARAVTKFRYHVQAPFYCDAVTALGLDSDPEFLFVFIETAPPYLITIAHLVAEAMAAGRELIRIACERYRDCASSGIWPAYSANPNAIEPIRLPFWALREHEEITR